MRTPFIATMIAVAFALPSAAQEKKKEQKKVEPRIVVALPLGVEPGKMTKVTLRGFAIEKAKDVRVEGDKGSAKIVGKGKAPVPDKNPEKVGDEQVEIELTVNKDVKEGPVMLVLATPVGDTKAHGVLIETQIPVVAEKEPNEGFSQAQPVQPPLVIEGKIGAPRDVDVFKIEGKAGQKLVAEVVAARHGSALDAMLTLYNQAGQQVASNDDFADSRDARLEVTLPADGVYYLSLIDAHDLGSVVHVYRLVIR